MIAYVEINKLESIKEKDNKMELTLSGLGQEITLWFTKADWIEIGCKIGEDAEAYEQNRYYTEHPEEVDRLSKSLDNSSLRASLNETIEKMVTGMHKVQNLGGI